MFRPVYFCAQSRQKVWLLLISKNLGIILGQVNSSFIDIPAVFSFDVA